MECMVNGVAVRLQFDSAADVTILDEDTWVAIGKPPLSPTEAAPMDASNNPMTIIGVAEGLSVELFGKRNIGRGYVAKTCGSLFGIEWIDMFGLWDKRPSSYCMKVSSGSPLGSFNIEQSVGQLRDEFRDVFSPGLGSCNITCAELHLINPATTIFRPKREVPFAVRPQVEEELSRLESLGIISPVTYSRFAAPVVIVKKPNGKIRICADYSSGLNDALHPHEYPIPTPDAIFATLSSCTIFSRIDLSDAYLQIPVNDAAKELLTITTHRGLYHMNRLCPGVKPAAGIFQQTMDRMLQGLEGVIAYFDDILVASRDYHTHTQMLKSVFQRLRECNFRARSEKCNFFQIKLHFLGINVDREGIRPDPAKIKAIEDMPRPTNVLEVKSFLGAVTFYNKFVKSMSTIREPLDALLRKGVKFEWTKGCEKAFNEFKRILASPLLLTHFDPSLPIAIAADASQYGIGACIYHTYPDGSLKAFYHISRRLNPAERNYAQIEKEALAIVYAVTKFHRYIFGRNFTLYTDHRPLLHIFKAKNGIPPHTANRLQRWGLILLAYQFTLHYTKTTEFGHADVLSRLIAERPRSDEDLVIANVQFGESNVAKVFVEDMNANLPTKFSEIVAVTHKDPTMGKVFDYVVNGWPHSLAMKYPDSIKKYFAIRESLSTISKALIYRDRIIIPPSLRAKVLQSLHQTHQGMARTKALARGYVFWPGIDRDIEDVSRKCAPCNAAAKSPTKTLLSSWPIPNGPWERVHVDFAGPVQDAYYFVLVDAFSKWPEVFKMANTTTSSTIKILLEVTGRFGVMRTIVSDNGPQFTNPLFKEFCNRNNIIHLTTAPYHPMSNGLAERFVDTLKRALSKCSNKLNIQEFLRDYRATPHPGIATGKSPAEIMLGRKILLPLDSLLPPEEASTAKNTDMEHAFNAKHGAKHRSFDKGERIAARVGKEQLWSQGIIIERRGEVMYNVLLNDGRFRRMHANQLRGSCVDELPFEEMCAEVPLENPAKRKVVPKRKNWRAVTRTSPVDLRPRRK